MSWRKDVNSWQRRMETVINNSVSDIPHDVTFVVGEDQVQMSCHKIFLAIASPVFEAMFSKRHNPQLSESVISKILARINSQTASRLEEKSTSPKDLEIHIPDVRPTELKNIIKYAYTGVLNVDVKDAVGTMLAANKYDIPDLLEHCTEVLQTEMSNENVVTIYQAALLLNNKKLEEKAWEYIKLNAGGLLDSDQLLEFSEDSFCNFLKLEHMPPLESEVDVFKAMLKWGGYQCEQEKRNVTVENVRAVLKNAIPLIRYPAMSLDDLNDIVEPSGILSESECIRLYKYLTSSEEKRRSISMNWNYFVEDQAGKQFIFCSMDKKCELEIARCTDIAFDCFTLFGNTGDVKVKSVGIVLPLSYSNLTDVKVDIALYDYSVDNSWIAFGTKKVSKCLQICEVEFDNPVDLKSNVEYQVHVNIDRELKSVDDPVSFVRYKEDIMNKNTSTTTFNTNDNERIRLVFTPVKYLIWTLRFQY